jgi:hypothetical protein
LRKKRFLQGAHAPAVWAATKEGGLALIEATVETLSSKAVRMQQLLPPLERYGWHGPTASLLGYGDTANSPPSPDPSDNDGLWTGMRQTPASRLFVLKHDRLPRQALRTNI